MTIIMSIILGVLACCAAAIALLLFGAFGMAAEAKRRKGERGADLLLLLGSAIFAVVALLLAFSAGFVL